MTKDMKNTKTETYVAPDCESITLMARQAMLDASPVYGLRGAPGADNDYNEYGEDF